MHSTRKIRGALLLVLLLVVGAVGAFASETDDYIPEVTDRVARVSFIRGDVQIKRVDNTDWERAVLNLPIVEGDEIVTDSTSRLEIQFNVYTHLRIAENTQVRIVGLKDEGIAIAVPVGTVSLRAVEFDLATAYFEIDAPRTTVSIQKSGAYRIDAGASDALELFVAATEGGEARVYSSDAGFTVRDGRRARVFIGGNQVGEWEMADASRFVNEFDEWTLARDAVIADRLKNSHYDRYYDRDIYAADDLNDNGDWVYTQTYGYAWRPYRAAISSYSDWSPYRYGHWRWIPSYGWTWVNDEPWGWATYHHGRWVWYNGAWYWTPYAQNRGHRSWWQPALVVVNVIASNVCWYPLPWGYGYYDYNYSYYSHYYRRRDRHHGGNNHQGGGNPTPSVSPSPTTVTNPRFLNRQPSFDVPPQGVVTVAVSEFGRGRNFRTAPLATAQSVLSKNPEPVEGTPIILPTYGDLNGKVSTEIRSARTPTLRTGPAGVQTGAAVRRSAVPLDQELQKSRIFGNRQPLQINTSQGEVRPAPVTPEPVRPPMRNTGAVERPVVKPVENRETSPESPPIIEQPTVSTPPTKRVDPVRIPRSDPPSKVEPTREPVRPRFEPPTRNEPPPRNAPPPKSDPPPTKSEPPSRNDPPPKNDPPQKSDPSPTKEPTRPTLVDRKKDGRL
ncbi:MAG TPA: DUF6600 domain-containing protein [Pyrinomonadaceae bacterium]|nr:DUF6600 domain-containing protein [Pyrinomonadaceae bacterium]